MSELAPIPGIRAVESLLDHAPERIREILMAGAPTGARGQLIERAERAGVLLRTVSPARLDEVADGNRHQGVIAMARPAEYADWEALCARADALLLAADQVTDPRNLGAMLRAAEALGATGALVTSNRCARRGPTVTRTSAGASEILPVAMETNLARALQHAQGAGLRVLGADLDGAPPTTLDWTAPTVLVIGAEGRGLRPRTRDVCDALVRIPLVGLTESLNAAVAAGILLYEAARQRGDAWIQAETKAGGKIS